MERVCTKKKLKFHLQKYQKRRSKIVAFALPDKICVFMLKFYETQSHAFISYYSMLCTKRNSLYKIG